MNDVSAPAPRRFPLRWVLAVSALAALGVAGGYAWQQWQAREKLAEQASASANQQLEALQQTVDALRRDQRANARSLQDQAASQRVLRDEVLGLGQRNALLEQNVARLADHSRQGVQALRREEAELLLGQAQQRLVHAGDIDGARRLYALAAGVLEDIDSPGYLNLRQALIQERNALDALGPGIRARTAEHLAQWETTLEALPEQPQQADGETPPWWQQLLSPLVQVRPSDPDVLVARSERIAAGDALQIELSLARAALERGDGDGWRQALQRLDGWLLRLWPDTPQRREQRQALDALRKTELRADPPELGSTLQQLRAMREMESTP